MEKSVETFSSENERSQVIKQNALVVEDHSDTRKWIITLVLKVFPDITVIGVADIEQARQKLTEFKFSVALIDIRLPDGSGIDLIREIKERSPDIYCVVMTMWDEEQTIFDALQAGAEGYLLKEQPFGQLEESLRDGVIRGNPPLSPAIARRIMHHFHVNNKSKDEIRNEGKAVAINEDFHLSQREQQVLFYITKGLQRVEIADQLNIKPDTVSSHIKKIYNKLNVCNRAEASSVATRLGYDIFPE